MFQRVRNPDDHFVIPLCWRVSTALPQILDFLDIYLRAGQARLLCMAAITLNDRGRSSALYSMQEESENRAKDSQNKWPESMDL